MAKKKNKAKKLTKVNIPTKSDKIYDVDRAAISDNVTPSIAFTYLDVTDDYGLKGLANKHLKHRGNRDIYKELNEFLVKARQYNNIHELITSHISSKKAKSSDEKTKKKANEIKRKYNIESCNIEHIHCNLRGNGPFVLHGFVLNNCFEVVFIDPLHEIHK